MSWFRSVDGAQAGPNALGILVPPGRRTMVLLRPRALAYDLVPLRAPAANGLGLVFQDVGRANAESLARRLYQALATGASAARVEAVLAPGTQRYWVHVQLEEYRFLACRRVSGQPYQLMDWATEQEAQATALALVAILCPAEEDGQELYLNLRSFGR